MRVDPKALIKRLTPTATRYVELAAGKAVGAQHYEIDVEHVLLAILSDAEGECAQILKHFRQNRAQWVSEAERGLARMRAGNPKRPVISDNLFQWLEDAWLCASVDLGELRLRSGVLLYQALLRPGRYASDALSELSDIEPEAFRRLLADSASASAESLEATPSWDAPAGDAAAAGGGARPAADGALGRFTHDFTQAARDGKIDPIFGRHREIRQMVDILSRRRKNNPIIVGEPGVGKTALVEGLALEIVQGDVPEHLRTVKLLALDMGALQAGASVKGEFENRLKAVITEVKASPTPVVLFIDEAHTLIGAGGPQGGSDAANLLKPALARGELRTVAATTWAEYKKYFEKDAALERRFQMVKVEEPSESDAIIMIRGLCAVYEQAHGVAIRDDAVVAAVELSHRYISGRQLPDKAVDLLDTSAARVRVERAARPEELVGLTLSLAALERRSVALKRDLEDGDDSLRDDLEQTITEIQEVRARTEALEAKWQKEMAALQLVLQAREKLAEAKNAGNATADQLAKLRDEAKASAEALAAVGGEERLLHVDVDADAVGRTVSSWTGIPVGRMKRGAAEAVLGLESALKSRVIGQDHAMQTLSEIIRISHAGIRDPHAPVGVLLFVGPSGVGKTETALALADELYGGERFMTTINMSEFQEKHTVSRLIGSPPGYVGYGEGGLLTEAVRQRPYSVVLLDECEKADLEVMNLFYQVFDKGSLTDGEGRLIDFRNTLIILTSNLASDRVMSCFADGKKPSAQEVTSSIRPALSKHFQPALLARMSIVPYAPIASGAMAGIASLKLAKLGRRVADAHGLATRFDPALVASIAQRCTEAETGARNIDHILRGSLMPALASALLSRMNELEALHTLDVALDAQGEWTFSFA